MKIGLSCNALKYGGGLERYTIDVARGMAALGVRPTVFARSIDTTIPESKCVDAHRINVSFLPGKLRDAWFSWRLRAARDAANVDVLIGCNRVDSSEIAICGGTHRGFLRAIGRAPTFFDRRQIALESRQYAAARVVVAHSPMMRDELRTLYGVDDAKIRMLYPPVDAQRFFPVDRDARAALRARFGFDARDVVLLFPSSSHERKGLPLIEAALASGVDASVVVAVAGRPPERTAPNLRYLGYVKDIEDAYRAADFTILASKYEPFGLVGIESVMCGTPVILPATLGCHDAIGDRAKFAFAANDVDALRAAIAAAVAARRAGRTAVARDAIRYDPGLRHHVGQLLELARALGGGNGR
jgi:glycosyltransferase involved in cell wall biosynthesis